MTQEEHINYWLSTSEDDWLSALEILSKNERRHYALFIGHLSVEKLLKALFVVLNNSVPPYKHDLIILAEKCNLKPDDQTRLDLKVINEFNIQSRYPDFKNNFYDKCTKEFVDAELKRIDKVRIWIKSIIESMR